MIDRIDRRILDQLRTDARRSNRQIARSLGMADSTCHERIRRLQETAVITGYHAAIDLAKVGRPIQAIIAVRLQPKSRAAVESFRDFVSSLDEVLSVLVVSGRDDFLVQVAVESTSALEAFVLDHIAQYRYTADVQTSLVYEQRINRAPLEG